MTSVEPGAPSNTQGGAACIDASKSGRFNVGVPSTTTGFDRSLLVGSDFLLPEPARSATLGSKPPGIR
jgi:hypothetical protein